MFSLLSSFSAKVSFDVNSNIISVLYLRDLFEKSFIMKFNDLEFQGREIPSNEYLTLDYNFLAKSFLIIPSL